MDSHRPFDRDAAAIAADLQRLSPAYAPTPLLTLPSLAATLGVGQILAKDEGRRMLGSFKSLGGTYAGLRALAKAARTDITGLLADRPHPTLPTLICASDGNHGLAVAAAARFAGSAARVYLHAGVPVARARRIAAEGAEILRVRGTYDDAVAEAAKEARRSNGILIADTASDTADPVVADVMAGYGILAAEICRQVEQAAHLRPTHLVVQAGVGGLAAAMADGLADWLAAPAVIVVVEPAGASCVSAALAAGRPVRVAGSLETAAEMLSCGEASAPALELLRRCGARAVSVSEQQLAAAPDFLRRHGGPGTTPSGAAGVAAVRAVMADQATAERLAFDAGSRVLVLITEGDLDE